MQFKTTAKLAVLGLAIGMLTGCGGIGEGNALASVSIDKVQGVLGNNSNKSFLCFRDRLQLIGTFDDGARGDYSARARWTSSNPSRVVVSSGDVQADPDDITQGFFAHGTLIPQSATVDGETVTITAEYLGLRATYDVIVDTPDSLRVVPGSQLTADTVTTQNVAVVTRPEAADNVRSLEAIVALGMFDGFEINVTGGAEWAFDDPGEGIDIDTIATITPDSGIVTGIAPSDTVLKARANFTACQGEPFDSNAALEPFRNATADIRVAVPTGLTLAHEFDASTTTNIGELVAGTTERLRVHAQFADGAEQDLSNQAVLTSSDLTLVFTPALGLRSGIQALTPPEGTTPGAVNITANFGDDGGTEGTVEGITSAALSITPVVRTLESIALTPLNPSINALASQQFRAIGSYEGGTVTQDISRHVDWTSADTAVAIISNNSGSAGLATSAGLVEDSTEITATPASDSAATAQTTSLCVFTPETPAEQRICPPNP